MEGVGVERVEGSTEHRQNRKKSWQDLDVAAPKKPARNKKLVEKNIGRDSRTLKNRTVGRHTLDEFAGVDIGIPPAVDVGDDLRRDEDGRAEGRGEREGVEGGGERFAVGAVSGLGVGGERGRGVGSVFLGGKEGRLHGARRRNDGGLERRS